MQKGQVFPENNTFQIRVKGHLDPKWNDWFDGFIISPQVNGETILDGKAEDQAALFGLLIKIRDLGLTLLSVNSTEIEIDQLE